MEIKIVLFYLQKMMTFTIELPAYFQKYINTWIQKALYIN
jgi:hypothetical protein